jgi:SAM-dependent methyltransferase
LLTGHENVFQLMVVLRSGPLHGEREEVPAMSTDERVGPQPEPDFVVVLPDDGQTLNQDEEWCEVVLDGRRRRIRFHDYHDVYGIPRLYEHLIYHTLECRSPQVIARLVGDVLAARGTDPAELRVLDVGAGNGMVGEELKRLGVDAVYGVDIIPEAAHATHRDRPGVYDGYLTADLTNLTPDQRATLVDANLNTMVTVSALGFGDVPPHAFAQAYNLISTPGWLAFNIKEDLLRERDPTSFARLIQRMRDEHLFLPLARERYRHRLSVCGKPLYYVAYVARKEWPIP